MTKIGQSLLLFVTSDSPGISSPSQVSGLNTSGEIKVALDLHGTLNCLAASSRDMSAC